MLYWRLVSLLVACIRTIVLQRGTLYFLSDPGSFVVANANISFLIILFVLFEVVVFSQALLANFESKKEKMILW